MHSAYITYVWYTHTLNTCNKKEKEQRCYYKVLQTANTVGRLLHNAQKTENIWIMPQRNHFRLGGTECRRTQETGNKSKSSGQAPVRDQMDATATHNARDYDPNERREGNQHKTRDVGGAWNKKTKCDPTSWRRDKASGKVPVQLANTLLTGYLISSLFKV